MFMSIGPLADCSSPWSLIRGLRSSRCKRQSATEQAAGTPATSLTVIVSECDAEFITWFQTYAALKYVLESYHDYGPSSEAPDTKCPSVDAAKGVSLRDVQAKFPALFS